MPDDFEFSLVCRNIYSMHGRRSGPGRHTDVRTIRKDQNVIVVTAERDSLRENVGIEELTQRPGRLISRLGFINLIATSLISISHQSEVMFRVFGIRSVAPVVPDRQGNFV